MLLRESSNLKGISLRYDFPKSEAILEFGENFQFITYELSFSHTKKSKISGAYVCWC